MSDKHTCERCGKPLDPVNWWTVGVTDRYGGSKWKLCGDCAAHVEDAICKAVKR